MFKYPAWIACLYNKLDALPHWILSLFEISTPAKEKAARLLEGGYHCSLYALWISQKNISFIAVSLWHPVRVSTRACKHVCAGSLRRVTVQKAFASL